MVWMNLFEEKKGSFYANSRKLQEPWAEKLEIVHKYPVEQSFGVRHARATCPHCIPLVLSSHASWEANFGHKIAQLQLSLVWNTRLDTQTKWSRLKFYRWKKLFIIFMCICMMRIRVDKSMWMRSERANNITGRWAYKCSKWQIHILYIHYIHIRSIDSNMNISFAANKNSADKNWEWEFILFLLLSIIILQWKKEVI